MAAPLLPGGRRKTGGSLFYRPASGTYTFVLRIGRRTRSKHGLGSPREAEKLAEQWRKEAAEESDHG